MSFNKVIKTLRTRGLFPQHKETGQGVRAGRGHERGKEEREMKTSALDSSVSPGKIRRGQGGGGGEDPQGPGRTRSGPAPSRPAPSCPAPPRSAPPLVPGPTGGGVEINQTDNLYPAASHWPCRRAKSAETNERRPRRGEPFRPAPARRRTAR